MVYSRFGGVGKWDFGRAPVVVQAHKSSYRNQFPRVRQSPVKKHDCRNR